MRPDPLISRMPPHSVEAESAVIASCMEPMNGFKELELRLSPDDFYVPWHDTIWKALCDMRDRRLPLSLTAVRNDLERKAGSKLSTKHEERLLDLALRTVTTTANLNYYARIVQALAQKRALIVAGARIQELGWSKEKLALLCDKAHQILFNVTEPRGSESFAAGPQLAQQYWDYLHDPDRDVGSLTGFADLDDLVQALKPGQVSILAARPSVGKTSMALCLVRSMLDRDQCERAGVISLEMEKLQLTSNSISQDAGINSMLVNRCDFNPDEKNRVMATLNKLSDYGDRFVVYDDSIQSITDLRRVVFRMVASYKTRLIVIDYMQLLGGSSNTKGQGRYAEVSEVSIGIKRLAKQTGCHILVLCQLNREVEKRKDRTPQLSDLRDSGNIEQDGDLIILLHRPGYYEPDKAEHDEVAFAIVAKNRNGPTGACRLRFVKEHMRFEPW